MNNISHYKTIQFLFLLILLIPIFFILSCKLFYSEENEIDNTEVNENVLLPLQKGNYWVYETSHYTEGVLDSHSTSTAIETIEDIIKYNYEGDDYNIAVSSIRLGNYPPNSSHWLQWNGTKGLYFFGGISHSDSLIEKQLQYKYPVKAGDSWETNIFEYDGSTGTFYVLDEKIKIECITTDTEYITNIDTFACIKYHFKMRLFDDIVLQSDFYFYFSPNIGKIVYEIYDEAKLVFRAELIDYGTFRSKNNRKYSHQTKIGNHNEKTNYFNLFYHR